MDPNFLALATTLENLGARWLLAKKVNFVPCKCGNPVLSIKTCGPHFVHTKMGKKKMGFRVRN